MPDVVEGPIEHIASTAEDYPVQIRALFNDAPLDLDSDVIRWFFDPVGDGSRIERVSTNSDHFEKEDAAAGEGKWVFAKGDMPDGRYDTEVWYEFAASGARRLFRRFQMEFRNPTASVFV